MVWAAEHILAVCARDVVKFFTLSTLSLAVGRIGHGVVRDDFQLPEGSTLPVFRSDRVRSLLKCTRLRTDQRLFRSKGFLRRVPTWFLHVITLQTPGHLCLNTFPPEPKSGTARFVKVIIINRIVYTDVTDELFKNGVTSGVTLNEKAPRNSVRRYFVEIRRFELLTPCLQSRCSTN